MIDLIRNNINTITDVCKQHHVKELFVFGSAARQTDFANDSDVDLLVNFETLPDYTNEEIFYLVDNKEQLHEKLQEILNRDVDLIEEKNISNKYLRSFINKDKRLVYGVS